MPSIRKQVLLLVKAIWKWIQLHKWTKCFSSFALIYMIRQLWWVLWRKYHKLPPGPIPIIPIFGGLIQHIMYRGRHNIAYAQKYGTIHSAKGITGNLIVVNDSKLVKQLFVKHLDHLAYYTDKDRYHSLWSSGPPDIQKQTWPLVFINGDNWSKRRKHAQINLFKTMTNQYVQKVFDDAFNSEIKPYLDAKIDENQVLYPREICEYIAFNTIYHTMFGQRIGRQSKLYQELSEDMVNTFKLASNDLFCRFLPFLARFKSVTDPIDFTRNRRNETIKRLIQGKISIKHKNENYKSYIDYTHELVLNGEMTEDEEIVDTFILFSAGTDTTSSTLDFGIVLLGKYGDIQERVRREVLQVMKNGIFELKLVNNCPLFRALVHEVLRISSVAPGGIPHKLNQNVQIKTENGKQYKFQKGQIIIPNLEYIHIYNQKNEDWKNKQGEGERITLENFLDEQGNFVMNKSFISFSVGRRDCVGRQLAMKEIQLTLGYLLMNYKISLDKEIDDILKHRIGTVTVFCEPKIGVRVERL